MRGWLALAAVSALVAVGFTSAREAGPANVEATVNGHHLVMLPKANVGEALLQSHVLPRDGVLRSVVTYSTIDPKWDPGRVMLDNRPTRLDERLRTGDRIQVIDGNDAVEPTVERDVSVQSPGGTLPDVEREVWTPGIDGVARATVGERSGEVARQVTMREPVAAARVPGPVIALSFDDGPDPTFTPQVLAVLEAAGVKATFCVVGRQVKAHPELVQAIRAQGHLVCDHTQSHAFLHRIAPDQVEAQISQPLDVLEQLTGEPPAFLRAPGGYVTPTVIQTAHQHHLRVLGWAVDPQDWRKPEPQAIVDRVLGAAKPGAVVLMHDDGGGDRTNTLAALPAIIQQLAAQGYTFVLPATSPSG